MALPKFSTNYTRPGAYENPQAVVDTASGAIWAKAISNIGQITAQSIQNRQAALSKRAQEDQKANDSNIKFITEETDKFLKTVVQSGIKDPSYKEAAFFAISKRGDAKMLMERGGSRKQKAEGRAQYNLWSTRLTELIQAGNLSKDAVENFKKDYIEGHSNVNTPGGMSTTGYNEQQSNQFILGLPAYAGFSKNSTRIWGFDEDNDWNLTIGLNSDNISSRKDKDGNAIYPNGIKANPLSLFTYDPGTIDDLDSSILKTYEDQGIYNPKKGEINDNYLDLSKTTSLKTENNQYEYSFTPINNAAIEGSTSSFIAAKAASYYKFVDKANNLWETTLAQGRNIIDPDTGKQLYPDGFKLRLSKDNPGSAFDKESSDIFTQSMAQYAWDLLPKGKEGKLKKITPKEPTATERKEVKTAKEISEAAPQVYTDIFKNPESYFKNKKIGGKDVLKVNVSPGSVPADGGEVYPIIELGYKSGTSTAGGEQTVFTNDMIFDLSDPSRVRALIDMLPEGADMKKELKKLVGDNPIDSVSIETFEQRPILPGLSTN